MTASLTIPTRHPAAPDYVRRRLVAALLVLVVLAIAVVAVDSALASLGGVPASAADGSPADGALASSPAVHVARSGDTMWSIATEHRGEVDHGRYLDGLLRLNGGSHIEVGQAVRLP